MKIMLITVAGLSSRFSQSLGRECLKCIYYKKDKSESLLYRMLNLQMDIDKYIIVGGYKYSELEAFIDSNFQSRKEQIDLVFNDKYAEYGSGYSLYAGMKKAMEYNAESILFAEGDLFVDEETLYNIVQSKKSIITCNRESILANKSVAFYLDMNQQIHYIFDTNHNALRIDEPFLAIYNSGQVWKFADRECYTRIYRNMNTEEWTGTNLVFIQQYFTALAKQEYELAFFEKWINCNTVDDFENIDKGCI